MPTEDSYTPPNEFCPHPEYYNSPDDEGTEYEVSEFIGGLVRLVQPELVVETGTYHGDTSALIVAALMDNEHGRLVTIEKDQVAYERAYRNLLPWEGDIVELIHGNTMEYTPTKNIDLAFFDSWQDGRHLEFMRFWDMGVTGAGLKKGSTVVFHDTAPHHLVHQYVSQLEDDGFIKTLRFHTPRGLTIGQVL